MSKTLFIQAGNHFTGHGDELQGPVNLIISDGVIQEMGPSLACPAGAETIDLRERTITPGFIDTHVHLTMVGVGIDSQSLQSPVRKALAGLRNARIYRTYGFTTMRDLGSADPLWPVIDLRDAINAGWIDGPRLYAAGHFVVPTAGHGDINAFYNDRWNMGWFDPADGESEVRRSVRKELRGGADWVKTCNSGGYHSPGDDPRDSTWFDDEIDALVATASQLGLPVAVHAGAAEACLQAIRAGVRSLEHAYLIDREGVDLAIEKGTFIVPTTYLTVADMQAYEEDRLPGFVREKFGRDVDDIRSAQAMLASSDIKIAYGTDVGMFAWEDAVKEFESMVKTGISPARALRAGTSVAAELLMNDKIGVLAPGKFADIAAMPGDPIADITVTQKVDWVMQGGKVVHEA